MDSTKRSEIAHQLKTELDAAREIQSFTNSLFHQISNEVPSLLPHPDGSLRLQRAGAEARASLANYMKALSRYTEFTVKGIVPEGFTLPQRRYRTLLPVLVQLADETHLLIDPDSIVTLDSPIRKGEKFIKVVFQGQEVHMLVDDLRFRAKLEPQSES
jgi:hypothetical protein